MNPPSKRTRSIPRDQAARLWYEHTVQVEHRIIHAGLRQHGRHLAAMVGLVVEEVCEQNRERIAELTPFVVHVRNRPAQRLRRQQCHVRQETRIGAAKCAIASEQRKISPS